MTMARILVVDDEPQILRTLSPLHLTPTEWRILDILVRNPGKLISQRQILTKVWGPEHIKETHYLRVSISTRYAANSSPSPHAPAT
jgi:two-component system KDP operon response regulator KdpE